MEKYLFYSYLKYLKVTKNTVWPKLLKLPKYILVTVIIALLCFIAAIIFLFLKIIWVTAIFASGEIIFCLVTVYLINYYQISCSALNFQEYKDYCIDLKSWLCTFDITTRESVKDIQKRICGILEKARKEEEFADERTFKWLQTLIIPIVLVCVTAFVSSDDDISVKITSVILTLVVFAIVYGAYSILKSINGLFQKRKIQQLECFANDLQGVLDFFES